MLPLVVLISGTGSNLRAIQAAIEAGSCDARIVAVISDRKTAAGLAYAEERKIPTRVLRMRDYADRAAWNRGLEAAVAAFEPAIVVLAGFMKIVDAGFVARFEHRIVNVHPALLPAFPGTDAPQQAIDAGVCVSGCTVHLVDAGVDTGPILAQGAVRVHPGDDRDRLHARIQTVEHTLLPAVIQQVACGSLKLGAQPCWNIERSEGEPLDAYRDEAFVSPRTLA